MKLSFFVPGVPAPGGSKTAFRLPNGKINQAPACKRTKPWMAVVAMFARQAMLDARCPLFVGPVRLDIDFILPHPKSHYRANGSLKPNAPIWHVNKPDKTKLLRSTEDALTCVVWRDDSAVVDGRVRKYYGECAGAKITVTDAERNPV